MPKLKEMNVLVVGIVPSVIKYINAEFKKAGCTTECVQGSSEFFEKVDEMDPDVVVVDIQMEDVSTYEVIEKIKAMEKDKVYLVLYSFFIDKDMAKESILHRLFASKTTRDRKEVRRPIKYLGIFNENTFEHKIRTFLESIHDE